MEKEKKNLDMEHLNQDHPEETQEQNKKEETAFKKIKPEKKHVGVTVLVLCVFLIFLLLFSVVFALININNTGIIAGITINGIDVSGLQEQEAMEKLEANLENRISQTITLKYEDYETAITPVQFDAKWNMENAVSEACNIGRTGRNIIVNNYHILATLLMKKEIECKLFLNEELLDKTIEDISIKLPGAMEESSYYIEDNNLIITKGKAGIRADKEKLKNKIIAKMKEGSEGTEPIKIPVYKQTPQKIEIEKIYEEIKKDPVDAYLKEDPLEVHPHVDGVDFAISLEDAKALLEDEQEEYHIPLKVIHPAVTTNDLGKKAFPDLLGTFTTKYDPSNKNRSNNLELANNKINDTILLPGEVFSYNKIVGERTIASGYKEAAIYEGGQVVDGLGGGICQISSTLYNSVLYANLKIISRSNHQFLTSYTTAGRDATVAYGSIDFQFQNTRKYPIKIVGIVKNGIVKYDIYGIKEENEYEVIIQTKVTSSIPYTTKYEEDSTLEIGNEVIEQRGMNGCTSETYKIVKQNGKIIAKELLSKDTYNAMQRIVVKGTRQQLVEGNDLEQEETPITNILNE